MTKLGFYLFLVCATLRYTKANTVLIDTFRGVCPKHNEKSKVVVGDSTFYTVNHTTYISHKFVTSEDIDDEVKLEVFPTRCKSKDALDTCETYRSYRLRNVCRFLVSDQAPWSPFVKQYDPPVTCPLRKGIFFLHNGTLDPSALPHWTKSYWKVEAVMREQKSGVFVGCTYIEFQIV